MQTPSSQRTPSRSSPRAKGKATTDRPRARQRLQIEERAHWTSDLTKDFLQCCANDIDQFGRTTWIMLIKSPNQTGLGWDKEKNTITAPEHWWGSMIIRKEATKFRYAGLEHRDLMECVFRDVTAMGEGAYIPQNTEEDKKGQRTEAVRLVKVLPIFRDMDDQEIQDLRWWALRHLEKIQKVEMFLACDADMERHRWLYLENRIVVEAYHQGLSKEPLPPPTFPPLPSD
ncbi:hypothetical protein Vadar_011545 [Vaccinium darrowii]|uniref:Uncharacterized protein n=1 Tax=Vaccinium darrowii TaxID=229202 RepID=A0ACB7WZV2_9ERIC|nr:hypothetical protein Vadar_011545 [Vaccinium darrowii]